eukprot:gene3778-15061_t
MENGVALSNQVPESYRDSPSFDDVNLSNDSTPKYTGKYNFCMDSEYLLNAHADALAKCKDSELPRNVSLSVTAVVVTDVIICFLVPRSYYKGQKRLIESFMNNNDEIDARSLLKDVALAGQISFFANLLLITAKAVAVGLSGSLAIVSSLVDSAVDLVSGFIIWGREGLETMMANVLEGQGTQEEEEGEEKEEEEEVKEKEEEEEEEKDEEGDEGRTRLEPVAIVILSCIMASASVVMIRESIEGIISKNVSPDLSAVSIILVAVTIVTKLALYIYCRRYDTPSTQALATDHINDTVSNSFALLFGALGTYVWLYADPIGAILISVYIFVNWWKTGAQQIKNLTGKTAPSHILQRITWIAVTHDDRIEKIETVRAFRTGNRYLAEVDIVLPEEMTLRTAHNIGETLQRKIEQLDQVERAFVHVDYEFGHAASDEHKYYRESLGPNCHQTVCERSSSRSFFTLPYSSEKRINLSL